MHKNPRFNIIQAPGNGNQNFLVIDGQRTDAGHAAPGAKVLTKPMTREQAIFIADALQVTGKATCPITTDTITRDQRSILMYAEICAVDYGGLLEGIRMNTADHKALAEMEAAGILKHGRIPGKMLGTFQRGVTHWCDLTEAGWTLAHQLRRERAAKPESARQKVDKWFANNPDF